MKRRFFRDVWNNRSVIFTLSKREFKNNYVGSSLGFTWTFLQPLALALILWTIFTYGFHSSKVGNIPFVLYLLTGLFPWNFFSECINQNTVIIPNFSYLVKKIPFQVSALPLVKILSNLFIHSIFLVIMVVMLILYKVSFSILWFQVFYYLFAMIVLILSFSWLLSAIQVFFKDTSQVVGIVIQIGFWATPIFWVSNVFPSAMQSLIKLNPMVYIVNGYRDSFVYNIPFWEKPTETIVFWVLTLLTLYISSKVFNKLSPHFADVL